LNENDPDCGEIVSYGKPPEVTILSQDDTAFSCRKSEYVFVLVALKPLASPDHVVLPFPQLGNEA
jgi:hypothetical protein